MIALMGLGAGIAKGVNDKALAQTLKLPQNDVGLLEMPLGYKQ